MNAILRRMRAVLVRREQSRGQLLIEVLISLAILGLIAAAFMGAVYTSTQATRVSDERATAQTIAETQMEYLKSCAYDATNNPPVYGLASELETLPTEFGVFGYDPANPLRFAERLDPEADGEDDDGLQLLTVTVTHGGYEVLTLQGYKVSR